MFHAYVEEGKDNEELKEKLVHDTHKFRQALKRQNKKNRRKLSLNSVGDGENDDGEQIEHFLELVNEFVETQISEEMKEYYKSRA